METAANPFLKAVPEPVQAARRVGGKITRQTPAPATTASVPTSEASLFHEGDFNDLVDALGRPGTANRNWWYVDNADLALGQGNRRGVLMEFDRSQVRTQPSTTKPSTAFTGPEYYAPTSPPKESLRSVTIKPDALLKSSERTQINDLMRRNGWDSTRAADGSITYKTPAPATARPPEKAVAAGITSPPAGAGTSSTAPAAAGVLPYPNYSP